MFATDNVIGDDHDNSDTVALPGAHRNPSDGVFQIDREGRYFESVLNYLRTGTLIVDEGVSLHGVLEEARFFHLESLMKKVEERMANVNRRRDQLPLSRREIIQYLLHNPYSRDTQIRLQGIGVTLLDPDVYLGVNLTGCDLSRLDLRNANMKMADLSNADLTGANLSNAQLERANLTNAVLDGANLSNAQLERANLTNAVLDGALLVNVKMAGACLENAQLRHCTFEDGSPEHSANLESCNLRGAHLDGSQMSNVNLRVACLKRASLVNCMLRCAVLAGADLQDCDMSGSDLQDANLRGANLLNTIFDDMRTAVHMSQMT